VYAAGRLAFHRLSTLAERSDARRLSLLVAVGFAVAYALLSGWAVPVRRALVLLIAVAIGFLRRRPGRRGHPLALAALIVLGFEPGALFDAGAQMSFAASAALVAGLQGGHREYLAGRIGGRIRRYLDTLPEAPPARRPPPRRSPPCTSAGWRQSACSPTCSRFP
jgi:predicted membrane metal-binding protein